MDVSVAQRLIDCLRRVGFVQEHFDDVQIVLKRRMDALRIARLRFHYLSNCVHQGCSFRLVGKVDIGAEFE